MRCLKKLLTVCMATALLISTVPMALTSVSAAGLEPLSKNMITNGSFENGLTGWTIEGNTTTKETTGPDGSKAILVTQDASGRRFLMDNKISIERNALYLVSVDVKLSQDLVNKNVSISILDAESTDLVGEEVGKEYDRLRRIAMDYTGNLPADEWTTLTGYYRYNGAKADGFTTNFGVEINAGGAYSIDNFSVVKVSEPDTLVINYEKEGTPNPWVSPDSNPNMTVKRVSMQKHDGKTGFVTHFGRKDKTTRTSEYYLPVEVAPDGTDRQYHVTFYAKLDESNAPTDVGLYPMALSRGYGDYSTAYGSMKEITASEWTKFEFNISKKSSFNFQIRPIGKDSEGKLVSSVNADAHKFGYYISDLSIVETSDKNKNNVMKFGEFNTSDSINNWSFANGITKQWVSEDDGNGYVKLTNAGITGSNAVNVIGQAIKPSQGQYIKRDTWYRCSVKMKLEATTAADAVDAQMFIFNTAEPKYNTNTSAWDDQSYYNTGSFKVNKADGWTEMVSYLRFSGIETAPATKTGYYEEGEPVSFLNCEGTQFAIRLYKNGSSDITACDISFDDVVIEEVGVFANGDMEDINAVRFNNNHVYNDAIKRGDGAAAAGADSLTQGQAYNDMNNCKFVPEAAHSGEYGLFVEGSKAVQTAGAAKQHLMMDASLDKYYKVSYWIKLKDPEAAKAAMRTLNAENTDPKFYARLIAGYMSYYDRPLAAGGSVREVGDIGSMYPAANDITDGEWHNVSFVYNPSHYNRFVTATEGTTGNTVYDCKWKVPAASLAAANMKTIGFYLYPRISSTNFKLANGTELKEGHFHDKDEVGNGFDYYMDDITIEEIPAKQFIVTSELKTEYKDGGTVKMEVGLANTLGKDQNATILIAQYDSSNALISVNNTVATTIYKDRNGYGNDDKFFSGAHEFEFEVTPEANAEYMKVFVWDGLENAIPLSKSSIYFKK